MGTHRVFYLVLGLSVIVVLSVQVAAYYYFQTIYGSAGTGGMEAVSTLINYGNGTLTWYNETNIPAGWNFYNLTLHIANSHVDGYFDSTLREHFVTGINGVENQPPRYWTLWIFCDKRNAWATSPVGADKIHLGNQTAIAWAFQVPYQSPVPGASTVGFCS